MLKYTRHAFIGPTPPTTPIWFAPPESWFVSNNLKDNLPFRLCNCGSDPLGAMQRPFGQTRHLNTYCSADVFVPQPAKQWSRTPVFFGDRQAWVLSSCAGQSAIQAPPFCAPSKRVLQPIFIYGPRSCRIRIPDKPALRTSGDRVGPRREIEKGHRPLTCSGARRGSKCARSDHRDFESRFGLAAEHGKSLATISLCFFGLPALSFTDSIRPSMKTNVVLASLSSTPNWAFITRLTFSASSSSFNSLAYHSRRAVRACAYSCKGY